RYLHQAEKAQRRVYMGLMARFKFQDASNYLELAGQCFRVAKRFQDAGVAYKQCGRLEEKLNNPEVAASFYHEAALCFQKDDPQEAAACYLSAINLFCQRQLFSTAARLECEVAELMQNDRNRRLAIVHHIKAADFYRANTCFEEATDRCLLKAAHALALSESYVEAASLFQEVGRRMLVDDLLGFNTPDTFLKAVLCLQCASGMPEPVPEVHQGNHGADAPSPRPTLNSVKATIVALGKASSHFQGSIAYIFATDVALAEKEGDVEFFAARLYAYNNVYHLSAWYLRMLKTIGDHIQVKAVQLRKKRALQASSRFLELKHSEKLRRRQRAEERAKDRIKRRQQDLSIQDDSSEGTASEQANDFASSSEDTLRTNTDTKPTQSSSNSSSESGGSDSDDEDDSSSSDSGSDDSEASSGTSDSSPSGSSSSLESGSSRSSQPWKEDATDGTPAKESSAKTKAAGGAAGASPTVSDSDLSATRSETGSENSNSTVVNAPNTEMKSKGSVRFAKSTSSASDSGASNAASGSAKSSGDSEGGSSSGSSEDSKGAKKKAGKEKSGGNIQGKQSESEGGKKTKSSFWKR
ncbi:unnamed protein product, partial [Ectocarpus sp. 12 AP-2014]